MKELGVGTVARSKGGFIAAYNRAWGNPARMSEGWKERRLEYISRYLPQYKNNPTEGRKLGLIAWGYMP
jgi:hypothetical protein